MPEIAKWTASDLPYQINYDQQTLEAIREAAVQGLMDLPKVGLGSGGLLLGKRDAAGFTVSGAIEIPCTHAFGPSFILTPAEQAHARELMAAATEPGVIGWYISKGVRALELTDADRKQLAELFKQPWQLGLLVQPHIVRNARVAFFFPDTAGSVRKADGGELAPWFPETPAPESQPETKAAAVEPAPPVEIEAPKRTLMRMPEQLRDDMRLFALVTRGDGGSGSPWTVVGLTVAVMLLFISAFGAIFMRN